jgi:hypothetical protein
VTACVRVHSSLRARTVLPGPKLEPNAGSDRSWVWTCPADLADGAPQMELFAMRFANADGTCVWERHNVVAHDECCDADANAFKVRCTLLLSTQV